MVYETYNCSKCGKNAKWNTPAKTKEGDILCQTCAYKSKDIVQGIDQLTLEYINIFIKNNIVIWHHRTDNVACGGVTIWYNGGGTSFPVHEHELTLFVPELFDIVESTLNKGNVRCTRCKSEISLKSASGKLFAGIECAKCAKQSTKCAELEIKNGNICGMCRKPYSRCYC